MTISYDSLSKEDKNIVDGIAEWVEEYSEAEVLGNRELLKKKLGDSNYISKNDIYRDYLSVKDDIKDRCTDELFFTLMEKLTGSRFTGFIDKYKRDPSSRLEYQPSKEWFDMEQLLVLYLEDSGSVSIDNIASFMCIDKEFDEKVIRLSKPRFKAIGKVYKKTYAIDKSREDRKKIQIDKDKIFTDRYDVYLVNYYTAKLSAYAIEEQINKSTIDKFLSKYNKTIKDLFSYKDKIGEDRFKRILSLFKNDILKVLNSFNSHNKEASKYGYQFISSEEMIHNLADYMEEQTQIYNKGNSIIKEIDKTFTQKATHFKTLQEEHLRYHSQK